MRQKKRSSPIATTVVKPRRRLLSRKRLIQFQWNVMLFILFLALFSYLTNPFTKFSVVKDTIVIFNDNGVLLPKENGQLYLVENYALRQFGNAKALWHVIVGRMSGGGKPTHADSFDGIIDEIHTLRFTAHEPFLISGDHFSVFYPRSLGIFYHSLLDPRTARSKSDWENREIIYLKTVTYALATYKKADRLSTTVVPIGPESIILTNFFDPPSDTLYSMLYGIKMLLSSTELETIYPFRHTVLHSPSTVQAAQDLLKKYTPMLKRHYQTYVSSVTDPTTGLIRKDISLSGTKDSVIRQSSFYDNVILWKTHQLAQDLGITPKNQQQLETLKATILKTFWLPDKKYFIEDLSPDSLQTYPYSSDWLIAFLTGFLNPTHPHERTYLEHSVSYIQEQKLDRPFALQYQPDTQKSKLHWLVKLGTPDYGTHAIWSNWGMEYTKLLSVLYQANCNESYLSEATYQIHKYEDNILATRGYPEVYNKEGKPYKTAFYKSVHQTGWVVSFEQAKALTSYTNEHKKQFCPTSI